MLRITGLRYPTVWAWMQRGDFPEIQSSREALALALASAWLQIRANGMVGEQAE